MRDYYFAFCRSKENQTSRQVLVVVIHVIIPGYACGIAVGPAFKGQDHSVLAQDDAFSAQFGGRDEYALRTLFAALAPQTLYAAFSSLSLNALRALRSLLAAFALRTLMTLFSALAALSLFSAFALRSLDALRALFASVALWTAFAANSLRTLLAAFALRTLFSALALRTGGNLDFGGFRPHSLFYALEQPLVARVRVSRARF